MKLQQLPLGQHWPRQHGAPPGHGWVSSQGAMHCPAWQLWPLGQPQTPSVQQAPLGHRANGTQTPFAQQVAGAVQGCVASQVARHCPFTGGRPVVLQMQVPFWQVWPLGQPHCPPLQQPSGQADDGTQVPSPAQQRPSESQWEQTPCAGSQAVQVGHVATQTPPVQQPWLQRETQRPFSQQ